MTIEEFKEILISNIKSYLPESYSQANISFDKTLKNNNIELDSMIIANQNQQIIPNIYLNHYLSQVNEGRSIEDVLSDIARAYLDGTCQNPLYDMNTDFDNMKDQIIVRVVGKENNQKLMEKAPYREINDLLVTFRWVAKIDENGLGSVLITNQLLEQWKKDRVIDMNSFYDKALENTERLFPACVTNMEDLLCGLLSDMEDLEEFSPEIKTGPVAMYVITNKNKINGATAILYPGILEKMAEKLQGDFFILPSSIHEIIIVPDDEKVNLSHLQQMVKEVNRDIVDPEEILSNSIYLYNKSLGKFYLV